MLSEEKLWLRICFLVNDDFKPLDSITKAFLLKNNFICCSYLCLLLWLTVFTKSKLLENLTCLGNKFKNIMNSFSLVASIKFGS